MSGQDRLLQRALAGDILAQLQKRTEGDGQAVNSQLSFIRGGRVPLSGGKVAHGITVFDVWGDQSPLAYILLYTSGVFM